MINHPTLLLSATFTAGTEDLILQTTKPGQSAEMGSRRASLQKSMKASSNCTISNFVALDLPCLISFSSLGGGRSKLLPREDGKGISAGGSLRLALGFLGIVTSTSLLSKRVEASGDPFISEKNPEVENCPQSIARGSAELVAGAPWASDADVEVEAALA
jgi:hypothetical protein